MAETIVLQQDDPRLGYVQPDGGLGWPALDCFNQPYERRNAVLRMLSQFGPPSRFVVIPAHLDSNEVQFVLEVKGRRESARKGPGDGKSDSDSA